MRVKGQTSISLVLVVSSLIITIAVGIAFLVLTFVNSSVGFEAANRALAIASAGANDGILRLTRNKDFSSGGYTVDIGSNSASVTVTQDSPVAGQVTIVSQATILYHKRKVQVVVSINDQGQATPIRWSTQSL